MGFCSFLDIFTESDNIEENMQIQGKYNTAEVFTDNIDNVAYSQILNMMCQCWAKDVKVRIMPDVHAGKDCTVGTTMTIKDKVVPNLVGVDIGCGMLVAKLKDKFIEFGKLDKVIKTKIPSGKEHRTNRHRFGNEFDEKFEELIADVRREELLSIGSLGGGNHFIEVDKDDDGAFYVVIHSGSRHLGVATCEYWQNIAIKDCADLTAIRGAEIAKYKNQGKTDAEIKELMKDYDHFSVPKNLSYLTGEHMQGYLHDMEIVQQFAVMNRAAMLDVIVKEMGFKVVEKFETIHNYIDLKNMILRKGSISAQAGERVIIPMNMRDGSLICVGKGNEDWNYSAPHGAGRLMTRADAKNSISMAEYKDAMKGIFTSCVSSATIDESPMAYKPMQEIITNIEPTCTIEKIIKPVYNFKAAF